ncbi:hypothetical protein BGZ96_012756 [Linnemannia gamsii]|uniref:Uncharacterized protein n=1 Tax=Linnemannia gamsii TaxID=64522 RepID=A0ABQ7JPV1_9FUNG|nr:hypothetical protein BGZ96_012756 [Linnemannia gamsii]
MSKILPDIATQYGLRQYQLTIIGFVVIHGFLHIALFMDGMVNHLFFVLELITLIYIYFFPAEYTARPLSKLRNQIPVLLIFAALWASHHMLLPFRGNASLFSPKEVLLEEVAKTLRRNAGQEATIITQEKQDGQESATVYTPYANQMATFMGGLGGLSVLIAAWFIIEAFFVSLKYFAYTQLEKDKKAEAAPAAAAKKEN